MIRLLALAGCVLAGTVVAAEVIVQPGDGRHPASARPQPVVVRTVQPGVQAAGSLDRSLNVVLGRPLFAPDRKPTAGPAAADPSMPRLTGIIASPGGAIAIFQPSGDAKPMVARQGDVIAGWEVGLIEASSVDLRRSTERVVLRPRFANAQGEAVKPAKPVVSRWEAAAPSGMLRARWSNPQLQP